MTVERLGKLLIFASKYYSKKKMAHALRVAAYAAEKGWSEASALDLYAIGIAHDLIEDTDCPQDTLELLLDSDKFTSVLILTKSDDESYQDYIERLLDSGDKIAFLVKQADLKDHMALTDTLTDKLKEKYVPILHYFL